MQDHNDRLKFISNFSGSYGYALYSKEKNYLFVDGRYTLQAENESSKLFKIITFHDKLPREILKNKQLIIGFDPKLFTMKSLSTFLRDIEFKPKK